MNQGVDQGAARTARRRVHDHPGGLVHHDEVGVLPDDVEGDVLGPDVAFLGRTERDLDRGALGRGGRRVGGDLSVHSHGPIGEEPG